VIAAGLTKSGYSAALQCIKGYEFYIYGINIMNEQRIIIDLGDLRIMSYEASPENCINSSDDFVKLDSKICRQLAYYDLRSFLIIIHDALIAKQEADELFPFNAIAGMMAKYVLLNSDISFGWRPIFAEEFLYFFNMVLSCASNDPEFIQRSQHDNKDIASLFLKMIGNQTRWNIQYHNMWGSTLYIYRELINKSDTPDLIREIADYKFEEKFGLSIFNFIKLGFIINYLSHKPGYINREYFDILRRQKMPIPEDNTILTFLEHISINPLNFRPDPRGTYSPLKFICLLISHF
jgi:hypothetical protein